MDEASDEESAGAGGSDAETAAEAGEEKISRSAPGAAANDPDQHAIGKLSQSMSRDEDDRAGVLAEEGIAHAVPEATAPAAHAAKGSEIAHKVRLRMRNETFYDDYLHRGCFEISEYGLLVDTPLRDMSYYDYGAHVRIEPGDPDDLGPNQFAFARHHWKYDNYVQELRAAPVVPYIHGFTMPTHEKDAEINACFKQSLLRPHHCKGRGHCFRVDCTETFCSQHCKQGRHSFQFQWRLFVAQQKCLAEAADERRASSKKLPVLQDTTALRQWWPAGAQRGGEVHEKIVPLLAGVAPYPSDPSLAGTWRRSVAVAHLVRSSVDSMATEKAWPSWMEERKSLQRFRLPVAVVWDILCYAGYVRKEDGGAEAVANSSSEAEAIVAATGEDTLFTGPGHHDEQLTPNMFYASRRVEVAARLEYMAEARGRPRPGQLHPEAEADDPDCVIGGGANDDDRAEFDKEDALPGDGDEADKALEADAAVDPEYDYRAYHLVQDDEMDDVVHRTGDTKAALKSKQDSIKKRMLQAFERYTLPMYKKALTKRVVEPPAVRNAGATASEHAKAKAAQEALSKKRAAEEGSPATESPPTSCGGDAGKGVEKSRPLRPDEIPRSPMAMAAELIATSGVWKSKEQYLATLFMLQPVEQIWRAAQKAGDMSLLASAHGLAKLSKDMAARRLFLHGPGGSGKTYCMTEVVMKVVKHFFGKRGVKAIAASNSTARLLLGKTMHAAGKLTRGQSLLAARLKPNSRAKKKLQMEWEYLLFLLGDELSLALPPLLAGISRRASHGRKELLHLDMQDAMERPFGDVLLQALLGDFMQLNPVSGHVLLEALLPKGMHVPGTPKKTTPEDEDGYAIFRKFCQNTVVFNGTHRFLDEDLPRLLSIMRTPGGAKVPKDLKQRVVQQIQTGPQDPRLTSDYEHEGVRGFFAHGAHIAIQWEQVARMQQLHALTGAAVCQGARATTNKTDGKPNLSQSVPAAPCSLSVGQLVYYFQAVDRFRHPQPRSV